ncbi:cyclin-dependent kinase regulatory subunit [Lentinus tigrinus ALCF2SS1-7]|uniref:Cyclin-dependent kinases regulatory subunit n=1 Tax=Lentinus tigrinus ALCF2SS1-6 TaxID=1328759 RepID=A0A5C2STI2_9APHY|nr:cyclin-dependent kinase regulatory subunit [Lentinus tigrinus ALCF2SS1-6]RPD80370.1 cyclin-dependent kinase regulatory subunit [Lentinus tigrinus ALCF2SS1-7]
MDAQEAKQQDAMRKLEEYIEKIHYSERYSDDEYEYRHVILPKPLFKMIPKNFFNPDNSGTLRLLTEEEWRGIGITQSLGWEHYEVHAPEPHVLLFRRPKNFDQMHAAMNGRAAGGGKQPAKRK